MGAMQTDDEILELRDACGIQIMKGDTVFVDYKNGVFNKREVDSYGRLRKDLVVLLKDPRSPTNPKWFKIHEIELYLVSFKDSRLDYRFN